MRLITRHAIEYECPKCQNHDLKIELWDDDWTTYRQNKNGRWFQTKDPEPSPLEDGLCPENRGGCGFKGFRMDFDPTGIMRLQWEATAKA